MSAAFFSDDGSHVQLDEVMGASADTDARVVYWGVIHRRLHAPQNATHLFIAIWGKDTHFPREYYGSKVTAIQLHAMYYSDRKKPRFSTISKDRRNDIAIAGEYLRNTLKPRTPVPLPRPRRQLPQWQRRLLPSPEQQHEQPHPEI